MDSLSDLGHCRLKKIQFSVPDVAKCAVFLHTELLLKY